MNIPKLMRKHGRKRFVSEGLQNGNAYMVVEDTIMYVREQDCSIVEGMRLSDMQDYIQCTFTLPPAECTSFGSC